MEKIVIQKYKLEFSKLTKKLYEENQELYQKALIYIRMDELNERASYQRKINRPNRNGTKITFVVCQTPQEFKKEQERLLSDAEKIGITLQITKGGGEHDH